MSNAFAILERAERLFAAGRYEAALRLFLRADAGDDAFLRAEILWRRAECLRLLGRFQKALALYWQAHRAFRLLKVPSERLRALLGASACLRILGRFKEAQRLWTNVEGMKFFKAKAPPPEEIRLERALVARGDGRLVEARALLRQCVAPFTQRRDLEALRHTWWALGGAERFLGRYRDALSAYANARRLARQLRDASGEAYALCGEGGCLRIIGRGRESLKKYRRAHDIFRRTGDPFGQAYGLCGMGNAHRVWGEARASLSLYRRSAVLYRRVGDEGSRAFALWGMGGSLRRLRHYERAEVNVREALRIFRRVDDERGHVMSLLSLSRILREQGRSAASGILRQASGFARQARLKYEEALCSWESRRGTPAHFQRFGIPPDAVKKWRDIP